MHISFQSIAQCRRKFSANSTIVSNGSPQYQLRSKNIIREKHWELFSKAWTEWDGPKVLISMSCAIWWDPHSFPIIRSIWSRVFCQVLGKVLLSKLFWQAPKQLNCAFGVNSHWIPRFHTKWLSVVHQEAEITAKCLSRCLKHFEQMHNRFQRFTPCLSSLV